VNGKCSCKLYSGKRNLKTPVIIEFFVSDNALIQVPNTTYLGSILLSDLLARVYRLNMAQLVKNEAQLAKSMAQLAHFRGGRIIRPAFPLEPPFPLLLPLEPSLPLLFSLLPFYPPGDWGIRPQVIRVIMLSWTNKINLTQRLLGWWCRITR
jgi:hypothetical protein